MTDQTKLVNGYLSITLHNYMYPVFSMCHDHPLELIGLLMPGKRTWNVLSLEQRSRGRGEGGSHFCLYRALTIVGLY